MTKLNTVHVRVTDKMKEYIEKSAAERGLTQNAVIVVALEQYFAQSQVLPHLDELLKINDMLEGMEKQD